MSEEKLSLNDLGLEDESTPAEESAKLENDIKLPQNGIIQDEQSHNPIEVKTVDIDMSEFPTGPKKKIPRPDNITPISDSQPVEQAPTKKPDLKAAHSTDANEGYKTVNIQDIAKTHHKQQDQDAAKKTLSDLAQKVDDGIERTVQQLTAPGGRIDEGKRKYVADRYETLMGRANQSPNLMKKIKMYQDIMETDPAFDGADEYEKKAYILFKVAKDTSIGIDDKSFGLAQESISGFRQSSADVSKRVDKMTNTTSNLENDDMVILEEKDDIPVRRVEELKEEDKSPIANPPKKKEEDDDFDDDNVVQESNEDDLIRLKPNKKDEEDKPKTQEEIEEETAQREYGLSAEEWKNRQKEWLKQTKQALNLNTEDSLSTEYSNFSTSSRSLSMNEALKIAKRSKPHYLAARWALQYTGTPVRMSPLSGEELVQFLRDIDAAYNNRNRVDDFPSMDLVTSIWGTIYNHLEMENKPSFNTWLHRVSVNDFSNFIFALYNTIFKDTNYITYKCPKKGCSKLFLEKHDVEEMIDYPNDAVKERIQKILNGDEVKSFIYRTEPIPISDTFAMSFITPTIYSSIFEQTALPLSYRQAHSITAILPSLDKIYVIDKTRNQFLPVDFGVVPDDLEKTVKRKVKAIERIFETFTLDQRSLAYSEFQKINDKILTEEENDSLKEDEIPVRYKLPETKCPVCGTVIPAEPVNAYTLLFTRARLSTDVAYTRV